MEHQLDIRAWPLLVVAALLLAAPPATAQGWIELDRPVTGPGVVHLRSDVRVRVTGTVAHVEVEDWFENRAHGLGEGVYLYPIPRGAVFSGASLFQGDQELRGETMDADRARTIYEEIVRRKRDPALIELAGHGLMRARIFPIAAGERRKIILRYTQVLDRAGDALQFRYVAGTRHAGPVRFTLTADEADRFATPYSPTHTLDTERRDGRLVVRTDADLRGRLHVLLPHARETVGLGLLTHRADPGAPGYFMLTLSPGTADGPATPRDVTVVLDVSGSMSGSKLAQAQDALHQLLGSLGSEDRFRLVSFSSTVRAMRAEWSRATPGPLRQARAWVDALGADGGTNIEAALDEAFRLSSPADRLPVVIFLTDGLPSVGERDPEQLAARATGRRGRARVFAFGVGHDVNTFLLDRLSEAGRGATEYVEPDEDVERALGLLAARIRHPVLTDLTIDAPVRLTEVYPAPLPDLFHGEALVVLGRYAPGGGSDRIAIGGSRAGRPERFTAPVTFPAHDDRNDFLPRLWAARKLGVLQRTVRLEGPTEALIEEIRRTALRYGLLSEYTAYLVQEPDAVARGTGGRRPPPTPAAQSPARTTTAAQGAGAVAAAEADRARREVRTVSDVAAAEEQLMARGHGPDARPVAGRWFVERDGVWTDLRHADSLDVVSVAPYSDAWFALQRALPELTAWLGQFEHVLIAGVRVSIRVAPGGDPTLPDVSAVVRAFRGP